MTQMQPPDFDAIAEALGLAGAMAEPAEIHGQLCGLVCVLGARAGVPWLKDTLADAYEAESTRRPAVELLAELARRTWAALDEGDMSFELLLPGDDIELGVRAGSLGAWCQGFLHGLGTGAEAETLEQGATAEIVRDFSEIARAGLAPEEGDTEAENAYAELVEFVRVSVQLVFEELRPARSQPGATLH